MIRNRMREATALALCVTTALCLAPQSLAGGQANFAGRVLRADGVTPLTGVTIVLVDQDAHTEYRARPTTDNGGFVAEVPAGDYSMLVETPEGAYLAARSLRLREGDNAALTFAISNVAPTPAALAQSSGRSGWPTWARWVIVGGIVVIGGVLISDLTDDKEEPGTPF